MKVYADWDLQMATEHVPLRRFKEDGQPILMWDNLEGLDFWFATLELKPWNTKTPSGGKKKGKKKKV